ncbi:succinyldiaminopimelate transaminase [Cellulomonas fimi]|uniref:Aminotransferase n=1 Tax=Cellulomonas fimi (strain ATCC 484 / DSM 20113 / JCM 1341 / CCUG 24087 / LMG 16345 / NBRC 15513 / NCIMB 8980 / NCTC 7547 / NRS-133) TaxID=590998 RepID=F4H8K7_CELFA|nr:succinyldiaminopimelate transaminase [Cellulomonas fimi]AEE47015.1 succinyldiaminopimelate transaminase [Cellulomonas fimi ATCC 484]NNH07547.1 succinyldiaminopimelate transaminase [Cellulomonas fimi]VEH34858.1 LL-diaminopimelate aminotransferase [Cellulomonas fimi]
MGLVTGTLPDFPWDTLTPYAERARAHPDGIVDLSVGTPVDPTPQVVRDALAEAADWPGYPLTHGTPDLRDAVVRWFARRRGVPGLDPRAVLPTVGSKELVALLPSLLGLGAGDVVLHPATAYPTYDVGARLAGATPVPTADPATLLEQRAGDVRLVWLNSPGNPDGSVLGVEELRRVVDAARAAAERDGHPVVVASDECYAELAWDEPWASSGVPSVLDPRVTGGDLTGLLAVYSLSKQSNLAGYRAAFVAGDPALVASLLEVRKHMGMIVPGPVQAVTTAALDDDAHVAEQRERYRRRRGLLRAAFEGAGYAVDRSSAGLYLWVRPEGARQDCWATVGDLAGQGILVAPGEFYGAAAAGHVRVALTVSDERAAVAAARLAGA